MTVAWFDGVSFTVEIAFATDPLADTPTWTDVSAYVRSVPAITHGRSSEFSAYSPSTLELVLANADRRFDPEYASSPYVGDLLPMKKIRVRATYSATTYDLFVGYIQGWPQSYDGVFDSTVTVSAVDGSRFLENATLAGSAYEATVLGDDPMHYWPFQDGDPYQDLVTGLDLSSESGNWETIANGGGVVLGATDYAQPSSRDLMRYAPLDSEMAMLSGPGVAVDFSSIDLWGYLHPFTTDIVGTETQWAVTVISSQNLDTWYSASYGTQGSLSFTISNAQWNREYTGTIPGIPLGRWFHLAVTINAASCIAYVNGQVVVSAAASVGTTPSGGFVASNAVTCRVLDGNADRIAHLAVYPSVLTAAQVTEHFDAGLVAYGNPYGERSGARVGRVLDEIGWPAADRDIATGDTVHGSYLPAQGSALSYLRDVEVAEDGLLFLDTSGHVTLRDRTWQWSQSSVATFTDDGTGVDYTDVEVDANTVDAIRTAVSATYRNGDGYLRVTDDTALAAYGPSTEALSVPTIEAASIARGLAGYKLRTMKDPRTRVTRLTTRPRDVPVTMFPVVLGLAIGQVVEVEVRPQSLGAAITKTLAVQGFEHSFTSDEWETSIYLAPAPVSGADAPYLLVNTSGAQSLIGAASGNLIAF